MSALENIVIKMSYFAMAKKTIIIKKIAEVVNRKH